MELVNNEFINQEIHQSKEGDENIEDFKNSIDFKNVSFGYNDDNKVLKSISLNIPFKSTTAFVGESGAGKTTLVDLITLTNENYEGEIIIDGLNSKKINKSSWRAQIGYVSQDTLIFDDTIANNISMWSVDTSNNENLLERITNAADQANILEFIQSLPNGFNTIVGDRGILLSGGQKQDYSLQGNYLESLRF